MSLSPEDSWGDLPRDAMGGSLEDSYARPSGRGPLVPLDVFETENDLVVIAAVPGATAGDLEVSATGDTLTIRGHLPSEADRPEASRDTWYLHEIPHGEFSRMIDLPAEVNPEQARATFQDGLLRLDLPKAQPSRPHRVQIHGSAQR